MIDYWRQLDFVTPDQLDVDVHVVGVGGLGSPIALALAKLGCPRIHLYDPDSVEPHNLPNQVYRVRDVGRPKVEALAELLQEFVPAAVTPHTEKVGVADLSGIVVSAVDSMASRRAIWEGSVRYRTGVRLLVDARLGGEVGRVLAVLPASPIDVDRYEATLFADAAAYEDACTAQATIYTGFGVAALVAGAIKRHVRQQELPWDQVLDFTTSTLLADW